MRQDLRYIAFDKRKSNRRCYKPGRKTRDIEDTPLRAKDNYDYDGGYASWNTIDNILSGSVGRVWNDVWSEICQQADSRSYVGYRIRETIKSMVSTSSSDVIRYRYYSYWVGENGILQSEPRKKYGYKRQVDNDRIRYTPYLEYHRINGGWFEVIFKDIPKELLEARQGPDGYGRQAWMLFGSSLVDDTVHSHPKHFKDVITNRGSGMDGLSAAFLRDERKYAFSKRQISAREARRLNLPK